MSADSYGAFADPIFHLRSRRASVARRLVEMEARKWYASPSLTGRACVQLRRTFYTLAAREVALLDALGVA